ncbi:MAG: DUF1036 domain-containing protein [Hyphomonadaceae bacterium]|nr:DUF1036 domain-containing protein [Hyphomonadaceae bacterium]MBC6411765.1 DUF1036 domain-containing protein [Hyphomonadaceae bacterium]
MKHLVGFLLPVLFVFAGAAHTGETGIVHVTDTPSNWSVCNDTSFVLRIAIASSVDGQLTPRGWLRARPGDCVDTDVPLDAQRFLYAESSRAHQGGIREWKGRVMLCVGETDFQADVTKGCPSQGLEARPYRRVSESEPVTRLVEPTSYNSVHTAGLQRLLRDNNYGISRIDGLAGRRTSRAMTRFLNDNKLPGDMAAAEKIDILEQSALEFVDTVGLTLCNRSSAPVWGAIGYLRKGGWLSRGWWPVASGSCVQMFRESLTDRELHVFALQEGSVAEDDPHPGVDRHLISNASQPARFCIIDARFSALGRENCADHGYEAADFRMVPDGAPGYTLDLRDTDFAVPDAMGRDADAIP